MRFIYLFTLFLFNSFLFGQAPSVQLDYLEKELKALEDKKVDLLEKIEKSKLYLFRKELIAKGLPKPEAEEAIIHHTLISLVYSEAYEQAKWVAHVIAPDIVNGRITRTDDFREDPKVKTGTAIEEDYFIRVIQRKKGQAETEKYNGFGWDRGHLAPSADFRWSQKALSESYFYSNISPQVEDFNRKSWAELENSLRSYVYRNKVPLYVVTGGVLTDELPIIEKSLNKNSYPSILLESSS